MTPAPPDEKICGDAAGGTVMGQTVRGLRIRTLPVADGEALLSLVEANLAALEPGLSLLDRRFPAGQTVVDLLALDARRGLVVVLAGSGSDPGLLVQAFEAYGWCRDNGTLFDRLFPAARVDAGAPPRIILLAERFSDRLRRTSRHLTPLPLVLVECRCLDVNGTVGICFDLMDGNPLEIPGLIGSEAAEEPEERARARRLLADLERLHFREAFR